jgi:hypothetical protein
VHATSSQAIFCMRTSADTKQDGTPGASAVASTAGATPCAPGVERPEQDPPTRRTSSRSASGCANGRAAAGLTRKALSEASGVSERIPGAARGRGRQRVDAARPADRGALGLRWPSWSTTERPPRSCSMRSARCAGSTASSCAARSARCARWPARRGPTGDRRIALIGLRGAGKSTLGRGAGAVAVAAVPRGRSRDRARPGRAARQRVLALWPGGSTATPSVARSSGRRARRGLA